MQKGRGKGALWTQGMHGAKMGDEWSPMARQRRRVALPAQVRPELLSHPAWPARLFSIKKEIQPEKVNCVIQKRE